MHMKVGIDLGTTYSTVARYNRDTSKPEAVNNVFGKDVTPSVICFLENGEILIGEDAKDMQAGGAGAVASAFKRGMGDPSYSFEAFGREYSAEDLSAMLLRHLIAEAESALGEKIDSAVITVPAYFNDFQRTATIRAGETAGVKVLKIINEPTAAAVAYGFNKTSNERTLMVYDLGGGTFDVTVVRISKGNIEVVGTEGNHILGGKDWDAVIVKYICEQFEEEFGIDPREDPAVKNELMVAAESYKKVLSKAENVTVQVKHDGNTGKYTMTRAEFETRTAHLLSATEEVCAHLLEDLGLEWEDVDDVLLVGGSTRMPMVSDYIRSIAGKDAIVHSDTDLAVAKGAAINAEVSQGSTGMREIVISDVTAHSLGMLAVSPDGRKHVNEIMITRNSPVPASRTKRFKIMPGNITDRVEVYTLQGESRNPLDCYVLAKLAITGFRNPGNGTVIDIEYNYDQNGVVKIRAFQDGEELDVSADAVPDDIGWMGEPPGAADTTSVKDKNIVLCVDLSRSMTGDPIEAAKDAMKGFVSSLGGDGVSFGLVAFGDKVRIKQDLTEDAYAVSAAIDELRVKEVGRGTDGSPFETARMMLEGRRGANVIVVLTDGVWGKKDRALGQQARCRSERINTLAIGFGEADTLFLREISTLPEGALYTSLDRLGDTFSTIATAISSGSMGLSVRE
ncbi:MAG: Hsp70 family protein [Candidatus Methanomethylophilaceae archaeon]|jgi:molecular chaperone DnaK|nr:Hsp70 family protein [Candidatus Methanomethylophilaceae archaeon]